MYLLADVTVLYFDRSLPTPPVGSEGAFLNVFSLIPGRPFLHFSMTPVLAA